MSAGCCTMSPARDSGPSEAPVEVTGKRGASTANPVSAHASNSWVNFAGSPLYPWANTMSGRRPPAAGRYSSVGSCRVGALLTPIGSTAGRLVSSYASCTCVNDASEVGAAAAVVVLVVEVVLAAVDPADAHAVVTRAARASGASTRARSTAGIVPRRSPHRRPTGAGPSPLVGGRRWSQTQVDEEVEMAEMTQQQSATMEQLRADVREAEELLVELGRETVQATLDAWRARIDNLRLQVELGRMEVDDEVTESIGGAESSWATARDRLTAASLEVSDIRVALAEGLRAARADLQAAVDLAQERIEAARR